MAQASELVILKRACLCSLAKFGKIHRSFLESRQSNISQHSTRYHRAELSHSLSACQDTVMMGTILVFSSGKSHLFDCSLRVAPRSITRSPPHIRTFTVQKAMELEKFRWLDARSSLESSRTEPFFFFFRIAFQQQIVNRRFDWIRANRSNAMKRIFSSNRLA